MTTQRYINNNKSKQNVCLATIKEARDTRQMRVLAAYYFLKQHLSHTIIYDYRGRKHFIAGILGVSERTVHTYIHIWKRWGLVHEHKFNLVLTTIRKVKGANGERRKFQIDVHDNATIEAVEACLYGKLMEERGRQMNHNKTVVLFASQIKEKRVPSSDAYIKQRGESLPTLPAFSFSIRNAAKLFHVSPPKATKILKKLNTLGVIETTANPAQCIGQGNRRSLKLYADGKVGHFFLCNGHLYRQFGNKHAFVAHPPTARELTFGRFYCILKNANHSLKSQVYSILSKHELLR